jgi:hypothetical protein
MKEPVELNPPRSPYLEEPECPDCGKVLCETNH